LQKRPGEKSCVKHRWRPRNGCDSRSVVITIIQVNSQLCCFIPALLGKSPELLLLKLLPHIYHHSHFLAATFISQLFHASVFCIGLHPFITAWLFLSRYHIFLQIDLRCAAGRKFKGPTLHTYQDSNIHFFQHQLPELTFIIKITFRKPCMIGALYPFL